MLSSRQKLILSAIIEDYVRSAEPIGSRALSKHDQIHLSAATIRNEMADLEDLGFLDQPHTSAGRIPSHRGYRFYVDHLMNNMDIDDATLAFLRSSYRQRMSEVELIVQQTSKVLSQLTQYTSIVLAPTLHQEKIRNIQVIPLSNDNAVAILVTETGHVESTQVQFTDGVSPEDIARMVNLLNAKLAGVPLSRFRSHLYREIANEMADTLEHYEDALALLDNLSQVGQNHDERVYVDGTTNMLAQPEFRDVDKVRPLLSLLERAGAANVLPSGQPGIQIRIGEENGMATLQECTVISAAYTVAGEPVGRVGVIGPTRMDYARVTRILDYVSKSLTRILTERLNL